MKKTLFFILFMGIFLAGCEKKVPLSEPFSGELEIWTAEAPDFFEALGREFVSALETSEITIKVVSFKEEKELQEALIQSLANGKGPDVIVSDTDFIFHEKQLFVPRMMDESFSAEYLTKSFLPSSLKGLLFGEALLGVPIGIDSLAMISNTEQVPVPPKTWDEFRTVVKELTKPDNSFQRFSHSGSAIGRIDNIHRGMELLENILFQMAGKLFSENEKEAVFAQNQGVSSDGKRVNSAFEAFRFFIDFALPTSSHVCWNEFLASEYSDEKEWRPFLEGRVNLDRV